GPIMWVIGGGTGETAARANGTVLVAYMLGLVPFASLYLIKRVFYAYEDARTPFVAQIPIAALTVVSVPIILALVDPMYAAMASAGAMSLGNLVAWLVGMLQLRRHAARHDTLPPSARVGLSLFGRLGVAAAGSWAVGTGLVLLAGDLLWRHRLLAVLLGAAIAAVMTAVFTVLAHLLRVPEVQQLVGTTRRKLARLTRRTRAVTSSHGRCTRGGHIPAGRREGRSVNTNPQTDALRSRWTLEGRVPLSGVADGAVWHRARSIATGEDVVLFVVRGEAALEAADAVRRAYLVDDPHLLTVKDIVVLDDPRETGAAPLAPAEDPTTVVEYALPPAPPLAALLAKGSLHPETARAIIGEAATGLEAARRRGVRHQFLDSNRVFVDTRSGEVVLLGIGVEAASHPGLDRSREVASFQDTAALVDLLYRALAGPSPRRDGTGDLPRPSTIADGPIPEDLDLLCDLVLNESADDIPETTRELIEVLQPWQSIPVTLEAYTRETPEPPAGGTEEGPQTAPESPTEEHDGLDVADDELESTALMGAVPDEEELPDEDTAARAGPSASAAATAAGTAGAAAAAGSAALAPTDGGAEAEKHPAPAPADEADGTDPADGTGTGGDAEPAAQEAAAQHTSTEAKALVDDLQLDRKRATSPFPGHLDISRSSAPSP